MRKGKKIEDLTIQSGSFLRSAIEVIDENMSGVCFVVDGTAILGVLTDGDLRRALLKGTTLEESVDDVMEKNFFSLPKGASLSLIQESLQKYDYIPIVDDSGKLVDYANIQRYHQIPLVEPVLDGNELEYVTDCILTGWVSSQGKYVTKFEEKFAEYVGFRNSLSVSNGTVALHLALVTLGIGPGDEVIVPDLTFAAPLNAVLYVGATPVILDVDPQTACLDVNLIEKAITDKTKAIIPVHLYGHPVDMTPLLSLVRRKGIKVIEDCAEALGSLYKGSHVGCFGDAATFSFFGNKTITTGEGGMVLFKDESDLKKAKILRDHGMSPERRYWHEEIGFNYRLTNLQAALGVAQLEKADDFVARKRWIAKEYQKYLCDLEGLMLPVESGDVFNSYWLYTVFLKGSLVEKRDSILDLFKSFGIQARPIFYPMHQMPPYRKHASDAEHYKVSRMLSEGGISLPSSTSVTENDIERVSEVLNSAF